jgi:type II secretory pathway component PulC
MVDNKTRGEQLFEDAKGSGASPSVGEPVTGKLAGLMQGVRKIFSNSLDGRPALSPDTAKAPAVFSAHKLDLKSINQVLGLILLGLVALTGYFVFGEKQNISSVKAAVSKIEFQGISDKVIASFEKLPFYLDQIKTRDIFNKYEKPKPPPPVVVPKEPEPPPPPPKVTIQEKAQNLKLMGISWGSSPKVIIRDESTQEVHFLKEGEMIKGTEINVKRILKNEIMISSDGDEMKML